MVHSFELDLWFLIKYALPKTYHYKDIKLQFYFTNIACLTLFLTRLRIRCDVSVGDNVTDNVADK